MSDSKLARRGKQVAALLAGAALCGGVLGVAGATPSSALIVKTPVDLAASVSTDGAASITRTTTFHVDATISNLSASAAPGSLVITVTGSPTASVSASGLTCGPQTPTLYGSFTVTCTTDSALAGGSSLTATLTLTPSTDPKLHAIGVKATAKLVNPVPALYVDPVSTNNMSSKVTSTVTDVADIRADLLADTSVVRTDLLSGIARLSNAGPDPVYAKFRLTVAYGTESSISPPAGVSCTAAVLNLLGTGYSRTCTTVAPLASGSSFDVPFAVQPSPTAKLMKITVNASKVGALVVDPDLTNNKVIQSVTITDTTQNG